MVINIQDDILKIQATGLLDRMLADKTTKKNIMWATDAYGLLGNEYSCDKEITADLISGANAGVIKTRARKAMEQQSERTKAHAEVFTPLWVCNMMNNHIDEIWFDKRDVFNKNGEPTEHIEFQKDTDWKKYVDSRRLEITCGEAPYLVSRYNVESGEYIPIYRRIGILDRKLRVVQENARTESEWYKWAIRAFQATYGYEFQGDNLLIARVNLLMTYDEYLQEYWNRKPTMNELKKLINIITWNIWQMDGLKGTIPYSKAEEQYRQMTLFEVYGMQTEKKSENKQPLCRIYDWRGDKSLEFVSLQGKEQ
ncbi:restriction endonuclease subunit M [Lachnospiraceae bacterium 48-21]